MEKIILVRFGEIFLKGKNRGYFERMLLENIEKALSEIPHTTKKMQSRYTVCDFAESDLDEIVKKLQKVSGIQSLSVADIVDSDMNEIYRAASAACRDSGKFKVETNRADKTFPYISTEVSRRIGGRLLAEKKGLAVDVHEPDFVVNIDIRENGKTCVYTDVIPGMGGMPVGSSGRGMLLISGGIDSPVAGYMMAKRGMRLDAIHFHSFPYTGEAAKQKVIDLSKLVSEYSGGINLFVVSFTEIQEAIHEKCPAEMMITMMRRFMMKIAERLAKGRGDGAIITGENLGQVASQTVESITSSNSVVTMPVFRPLIGFDKLEIIELARKIGTYETSILPYEDCCTVFLPKYPLIKPRMDKVLKAEENLDVEGLINRAMENIERITF
ncbi:MAG: tRNA 4-thiouridine(8) synthase ThiI [Clostridia bacterium]|nr:tRNA 4-thiouridine(8) synthase ThiI [Clostridia bacterium]